MVIVSTNTHCFKRSLGAEATTEPAAAVAKARPQGDKDKPSQSDGGVPTLVFPETTKTFYVELKNVAF